MENSDRIWSTDRKKRETKEPLDEGEKESEKADLKFNIQKTKTLASHAITSWHTEGEKLEPVTDFIFLGSQITADNDCSHKIKRCLFFGRKAMTLIQCMKKQKHHFTDKGPYSQSYGFSSGHVQISELDRKEG